MKIILIGANGYIRQKFDPLLGHNHEIISAAGKSGAVTVEISSEEMAPEKS
jgi:hypothetical protein